MNQQYEYPPPPPPQRSPGGSLPDRRRPVPASPPSITTNIARTLAASSQTPITATALAAGTPHAYTPVTPSGLNPLSSGGLSQPGSQGPSPRNSVVMEPYNPRQWSGRGQPSGTQMVFQQRGSTVPRDTRDNTGMEAAMPSPPPPYSPETLESAAQSLRSPTLESVGFTASPLPADTPSRSSPQVPMSPIFPPPPAQSSSRHRERSTSGIANRSFFNLSGLRGKQAVTGTNELQVTSPVFVTEFGEIRPPGARRAASTGQLQQSSSSMAASGGFGVEPTDGVSPDSHWQPGMPLPGPPPGPPPPGGRSQSLNRYPTSSTSRSDSLTSEFSIEPPQPRRAAAVSTLGPVPPTPADWIDPDAVAPKPEAPQAQPQVQNESADQNLQPLRIDTGSNHDVPLTRRPAQRDGSAQGIRERRSRSRAARDSTNDIMSPMSNDSRPNDLVFPTNEGAISRRREHMRTASGYVDSKAEKAFDVMGNGRAASQPASKNASNVLTPPYTPAVGKAHDEVLRKQGAKVPGSAGGDRPVSHLLHHPVEDSAAMPAPLTPSRPPSSTSAKTSAKLDPFALQAIERHRSFVEKEAAATSDEERLELFANFMVHESRLRRDRYTTAYNAMAGDIVDLTRDMWRSYTGRSKRAVTPSTSMSSFDPTVPSWASDGQPTSAQGNVPSSASSFGDFTPATDAGSSYDVSEIGEHPESRQWGETFKPSLSPIPSMAVSTNQDGSSSRGRTASRWWEASNSGSGSVGKPDRIEKSRRETKYMGVNPSTLQDNDQIQPSPQSSGHTGSTPGPSAQLPTYGPDEYPPEKVGWHEETEYTTPVATPLYPRKASTPGVQPLDVSRLVTLPPPYPRHHPAVNNSHPVLSDLRTEYRMLATHSQIQDIRDAYLDQDFAIQRQQQEQAKERRVALRTGVQEKIAEGSISFAEAAQAEADFDLEEAERGKANARSNFDVFETSVAHPLNTLLTERLEKANACINQLRAELESRNEVSDPNQAQEEGDEQPERLEKLTLLKWLFEAREQLHKEMFDLHADRSAKYSEVILTPYRIAKMQAKMDEATAFFARDSQERQTNFSKDSLKRVRELQQITEMNVSRGVEDQLSAFWDIAPGLLEVIQHVPNNLAEMDVQIPPQEYEENSSYSEHPLQYLYSLLSHSQRSAYQFIESQTNLLCLLHEVRTATTKSALRLREIERSAKKSNDEALRNEMLDERRRQEEQLTIDLQEKVGEVERQWREALGDGIEDCKRRVREFLQESGGWEDGLEG